MEWKMVFDNLRKLAAVLIFTVTVSLFLFRPTAHSQEPPEGSSQMDLADCFSLNEYYVKLVPVKTDPKTGFTVGGTNESTLIPGVGRA
jgi:hypothetical protein